MLPSVAAVIMLERVEDHWQSVLHHTIRTWAWGCALPYLAEEVWEFGNSCTMQAVFELFFQFASIQLRTQQEQGEKKSSDDELHAGWVGGEAPYQSPWGKNQQGLRHWTVLEASPLGFFMEGGNPGLEAPVVEQDLLVGTPWAPSSDEELLERGTSRYGPKYFVASFHGRVVVLPSAAVSTKPAFLQSSFPVGDFCLKYRTW